MCLSCRKNSPEYFFKLPGVDNKIFITSATCWVFGANFPVPSLKEQPSPKQNTANPMSKNNMKSPLFWGTLLGTNVSMEEENHLQNALWRRYVSSLEAISWIINLQRKSAVFHLEKNSSAKADMTKSISRIHDIYLSSPWFDVSNHGECLPTSSWPRFM